MHYLIGTLGTRNEWSCLYSHGGLWLSPTVRIFGSANRGVKKKLLKIIGRGFACIVIHHRGVFVNKIWDIRRVCRRAKGKLMLSDGMTNNIVRAFCSR